MKKSLFLAVSLLLVARPVLCHAAEPKEDTIARTIMVGTLKRTYYLHVPLNLPQNKALPLVILFHGGGGTPAQIDHETKFSETATQAGFLVACPEGLYKSWNDGRGVEAVAAQRYGIDDLSFVEALIEDVARNYKLDPKKVFTTGISNGAIFSQYLAATLSSRIAAIAPVAGGMSEQVSATFHPTKPVSILILQGTHDELVPYNGGYITAFGKKRGRIISTEEMVQKWVERDGCNPKAITDDLPNTDPLDGCLVRKFTYSKGKDGTEVVLYRIEGGGHTWPGVTPTLPKFIVGPVCRDINATAIILDFFKTHPRP